MIRKKEINLKLKNKIKIHKLLKLKVAKNRSNKLIDFSRNKTPLSFTVKTFSIKSFP